ncbi:T9SS type B sorting domain-containing protein [Flavobacterium sp. MAH-1]|uniref:T9SS type B sorting domain-containing protein n=1 Tax=Flavobacterium agri TaxID=2743471 RepID=A0A7Y8Y2A5_9FLAO|nr:choice-of-anchor L domain-containing protein [Flavobacterium agri]NUY81142.1 T9SS type B sorting domain-containing protein [Flavobacterium agri]NYA71166.1 T9SS type B sorting domain-containing protein [Flavobacterium agri]
MREILFIFVLGLFGCNASAQYISVDENYTTFQLVNDVLINNPCGQASNIVVSGWSFSSGNTFGYFNANGSAFPFQDGVVLTTGRAASAVGPNTSLLSEGPTNWNGDNDLENALNVNNTINATVLEFDFLPQASEFSFEYIFSSEQYLSNPSQNQCAYTDGFAFLLKKANTSDPYQNLAVVPQTSTPVTVNTVRGPGTVCPPQNEEYFDAFNADEHPTNYNGQTKPLTAKAFVQAGVLYHIKLVVADQGNNLYDSAIFLKGGSFKVEKDLGADRLLSTFNALCPNSTLTLNAQENGATSYKWYKNDILIPGATLATYDVTQPGTYKVEILLGSGCVSTGEIKLEYSTEPAYQSPVTMVQCDPDNNGISTFNLTNAIDALTLGNTAFNPVTFYESMADAISNTNPIPPLYYDAMDDTQVIAKMKYGFDCYVYATLILQLTYNPASPQALTVCDTDGTVDGFTAFDLDQQATPLVLNGLPIGLTVEYYASNLDALTQTNPLSNNFTNTTASQQIIYARVVSGSACYDIVKVTLNVTALTPPGFEDETLNICPDETLTLSVAGNFASYLWSTGETSSQITVNAIGNYTLTVTDANGCQAVKEFTVVTPDPPVFEWAEITNFQGNDNSIVVHYSGNSEYEFSVDGEHFQSTPNFGNLPGGAYDIYIRDLHRCYTIGPFSVFIVDYPTYFTPNGDGIHDYWQVTALNSQPSSLVSIFDRYGKLLCQFDGYSIGWDGKFNSRELPSTDYWFTLQLAGGRIVKGHFSLKR